MENYLRLRKNFVVEQKNPSEEVLWKWRYAISMANNNPQRRFYMVADLAMTEWKNRKFQVESNEYVAARDQTNGDRSPCELHGASMSVLSPAVSQCASQADSWAVLSFVSKATSLATSIISGLWTRSEQNEGQAISEITRGKQINNDVHNQDSLPVCLSHKTPKVLDSSSYLGGLSPKQTNHEGPENVAVVTRGKQVVVDIPYSSSSLYMNPQELNSSSSSCGPSRNYLDKKGISKFPGQKTTIDTAIPVSQVALSLSKTPQVLATSSSSVGRSQISENKVDPNENVADRDQTNGDTSDTTLLQALFASRETNSSQIEHANNLSSEVQQTSSGIASNDSGTTSLPTEQQTPAAVVVAPTQARVPDFKTAAMIVCTVISISGAGIVSIIAGLGENKTDHTHKVLLKAYTWLNYISFVSAIGLLSLTLKPPSSPRLAMIIKITMWITLGSTTSAFSCATSIVVAKSLDEVVIILVIPLVVVFCTNCFFYH